MMKRKEQAMFDSTAPDWQEIERLMEAECYQEATTAYEQFIRFHPGDASVYQAKRQALYDLKQYERDVYSWRKGDALETLERYEEALAAYEQAIQLPPNEVRGSQGRLFTLKRCSKGKGDVLSALGRSEEARAAYEQFIQLDPKDGDGSKGKGDVFSALGRYEEAWAAYEQALAVYEQAMRQEPSSLLAVPILELRGKLHHPQAPMGHLSADLLTHVHDLHSMVREWRTPASFQDDAILPGQQGSYQVSERLFESQLTTSYLGRDRAHDRPVMVKVLHPTGALLYLCQVAPRRLGLSDPHVERLLGYGVREDCCYLVTEYLAGPTLQAQMATEAPLPVGRALQIATQIAQSLEARWQQGISDGVLEPATIVLVGEQAIKLTDAGLISTSMWAVGRNFVTTGPADVKAVWMDLMRSILTYGAPELITDRDASGIRSDLYSLACILFELLIGYPPYEVKNLSDVLRFDYKNLIPSICALRPELAPAFDTFFQRALRKNPDDRYQTTAAFIQALEALQSGRG
jgi:serine/threonine protein kinase